MNDDVIRRLQDATRAVGETVEAVPPFDPAAAPARRTGVGGGRVRTWLMPVATAAAVTVAVAGGVAVARHGGGIADTAAGTVAGPAAEPSFFAQITDAAGGITIRSVLDGHVTAVVPRPAGGEQFAAVQAARDNRLFYAATATDGCGSRLYRFTLDDDGKVRSRAALSFTPPDGTRITSLAVDGDGSTLAYSLSPCEAHRDASLVVTDVETGRSRTWRSTDARALQDVSMSEDGRYVLFRRRSGVVTGVSEAPVSSVPVLSPPPFVSAQPATSAEAAPGDGSPSSVPTEAPPRSVAPVVPGAEPPVAAQMPVPEQWGCVWQSVRVEPGRSPDADPSPRPPAEAVPLKVAWSCSAARDAMVLDTTSAGTLDDARVVKLAADSGTGPAVILGLAITPDGSRVIAAQATAGTSAAGDSAARNESVDELVAYDISDGHQVEVLYRGESGKTVAQRIDVDGTGRNILVSRPGEVGVVGGSGYRTLFTYGDVFRSAFFDRSAW
ncbi:hypothetical protein [Microbispora sp. NPDC046933]|uniref:hypothetical protein n=1 Tax=Microbispora sp. NPDC046933 TaxID=3155618 RepID=UPI0033C6D19A